MLSITVLLHAGCNIPDPDDLHLAECMRICNATAESCLVVAEGELSRCLDSACRSKVSVDAVHCATDCVDCLAVCVDEAQEALK